MTNLSRLHRRALCAALLFALAACGGAVDDSDATADAVGATTTPATTPAAAAGVSADAPFESTFVGEIDGTDAFVALAVRDGKVWAYLCDGEGEGEPTDSVASYLTGAASGTAITAQDIDGSALTATIDGDRVTGDVTLPGGRPTAFEAARSTGEAGWFSATVQEGSTIETGSWIRLADGRVRGKVVAVAQGSGGSTAEPTEPDSLGGGGSVPPAAQPTGALKCFLATRRYFVLRERATTLLPGSEDAMADQIDAANAARIEACRP